jgi:uncharacterized protein YndB with AHSA1/START domain
VTEIDETASMVARDSILIAAPVERIWAALTDIARWPEWQPPVSTATLAGPLAPGTTFRWKASGMTITSQLHDVVAPSRVSWTGESLGTHAIHVWQLEPEAGGTRVSTQESMRGWLPRLVKIVSPGFLANALKTALQTLKEHAEG